tara:strand:+ start:845 stop:1069 length:225 start_codon:yes stop_codon:yes gene_type:complete
MIYVIIDSSEKDNIIYSEVSETSAETLRYSLDGSQIFLKFEGSTPSFLEGVTQYTLNQVLAILESSEWTAPLPE